MKKPALHDILFAKRSRLAQRKEETPMEAMRALAGMQKRPEPVLSTVTDDGRVMLFAQIRYGTPSYDPVAQALRYTRNALDGIALFTDNTIYNGGINDLALVTRATPTPIILQNYIFDEYQVIEARAAGAAALTLLAALVDAPTLRMLVSATQRNRMSAIVRVRTEEELKYALELCPAVIEIGGRDSETGKLNATRIESLRARIPAPTRVMFYNRLRTFEEARAIALLKPNAVLVSDALLAQTNALPQLREIFGG